MTRANFLAGVLMGLVVSVLPVHAGTRPSETPMLQMLNGEVSRDVQNDGGGLSMWTSDAGIGCATVATGAVYEIHCSAAAHVCAWGDGGCSATAASPNYGRPVNASTASAPAPYFVLTQSDAAPSKLLCAIPSASAALTCAVFRMR
jgi:hypothetical protein